MLVFSVIFGQGALYTEMLVPLVRVFQDLRTAVHHFSMETGSCFAPGTEHVSNKVSVARPVAFTMAAPCAESWGPEMVVLCTWDIAFDSPAHVFLVGCAIEVTGRAVHHFSIDATHAPAG